MLIRRAIKRFGTSCGVYKMNNHEELVSPILERRRARSLAFQSPSTYRRSY